MEEGVKSEVKAVIAAGDMDVEVIHKMIMNWTSKTVVDMMKFIREYRKNGKGAERDTAGIRVNVIAMDLAVVIITEEYWDW